MSRFIRDEKLPASPLSFLSSEGMRTFTEALSVGVMLVDAEGLLYHVNRAAQLLHQGGSIPRAGLPLADFSPHDWVEVKKVLATGIPQVCSLLRLPMATVLVMLFHFTPHMCEEIWQQLGHTDSLDDVRWPEWNGEALKKDVITVVVQVNGKLRGKVEVPAGASREDLEKAALAERSVQNHLAGKTVRKVIVVPGKLVNIVAG